MSGPDEKQTTKWTYPCMFYHMNSEPNFHGFGNPLYPFLRNLHIVSIGYHEVDKLCVCVDFIAKYAKNLRDIKIVLRTTRSDINKHSSMSTQQKLNFQNNLMQIIDSNTSTLKYFEVYARHEFTPNYFEQVLYKVTNRRSLIQKVGLDFIPSFDAYRSLMIKSFLVAKEKLEFYNIMTCDRQGMFYHSKRRRSMVFAPSHEDRQLSTAEVNKFMSMFAGYVELNLGHANLDESCVDMIIKNNRDTLTELTLFDTSARHLERFARACPLLTVVHIVASKQSKGAVSQELTERFQMPDGIITESLQSLKTNIQRITLCGEPLLCIPSLYSLMCSNSQLSEIYFDQTFMLLHDSMDAEKWSGI